jgi:hypothetical protein
VPSRSSRPSSAILVRSPPRLSCMRFIRFLPIRLARIRKVRAARDSRV